MTIVFKDKTGVTVKLAYDERINNKLLKNIKINREIKDLR